MCGFNVLNRFLNKIAFIVPGGYTLRPQLQRMRGVGVGKNVWISQYVYIDELHPEAVTIGDNVTIGLRTSIFAHMYWGKKRKGAACKRVVIEKDVFIGPHCLILPGVRIGEGAVVKGGSVLSRNVPAHVLWGTAEPVTLARATVPLTSDRGYNDFLSGLRPFEPQGPKKNGRI